MRYVLTPNRAQRRKAVGIVIQAEDRFVDKVARHYIKLYKDKGSDVAKKWALTAVQPEPRKRMIIRVNEILKANNKK